MMMSIPTGSNYIYPSMVLLLKELADEHCNVVVAINAATRIVTVPPIVHKP